MDNTMDVTIPVEPEAAAALTNTRSGPSPLAQAIAELKAEVEAAGLTDAEIDAELAAYNAERRDHRPAI